MYAHILFRLSVYLMVCLLAGNAALAQYDVYKMSQDGTAVPDVNKAGVPPPPGAAPGDMSCWQATAANLLAGAGWGLAANNAQQNGNAIYNQMTGHFTTANPGQCTLAVNWWLYNYGYNPAQAAAGWYRPELKYSDITDHVGLLTNVEYDFLLDELSRCQYVGVSWVLGPPLTGDHCITLVGGNKSNNPIATSVWHDSDRDNPGPDDPYANLFAAPTGQWSLPAYPTSSATGYTTLCPGLQKPEEAMNNYDAAYYKDQDPLGDVSTTWRVAGDNSNYGQPQWVEDELDDYTILTVPNIFVAEMQKEVYLLVDYRDRLYNPDQPELAPDIILKDEEGNIVTDRVVQISDDGGQILYAWTMDHQPPFEQIIFPTEDYYFLSGDVLSFNVATLCVPEPAACVLLAITLATLLIWRRRH